MPGALAGTGFLLALALVAGWPVLAGGLWYLDNPAHLAELLERTRPSWRGWSELAFCGFPLGQWHSPLAYGALAGWVRLGISPEFAYGFALWAAFSFPALVLFAAARKRIGDARAALVAAILLLQPSAAVGIESAWGGMWTFYLAAGGLLWLMQRWSSERSGVAGDAALIGAIGLIHLFALALVPLLAGLRIAFFRRRKTVAAVLGACAFGALASAAYWLPPLLAGTGRGWEPQNLPPLRLLWALAAPADLQNLTGAAAIDWKEILAPGTLSIWALLVLGIAGGLRSAAAGTTRSARLGLAFALAVLFVLLLLPMLPSGLARIWGPVSWRMLYGVRLGLAWSAVAALRAGGEPAAPVHAGKAAAIACLLLAWGGWIAAPLREAVQDPGGMAKREIRALWTAIRASTDPNDRGRIYMQDTYRNPDLPTGLARNSHVLAYTAAETGVRQLGAYYGMAPVETAQWTSGEFGRLCGVAVDDPEAIAKVMERLRRGNCTRLAVVSHDWAEKLARQPGCILECRSDGFALFRIEGSGDGVEAVAGSVQATAQFPNPGEIRIETVSPDAGGGIRISQAWHPDWTMEACGEARLEPDDTGLMCVANLPAGENVICLRYSPPSPPTWLSWGGWLGLVLAGAWNRRSGRKESRL